ncbi:MAG: PQ-loop repeat-containing protein [Legionellaceae bacterium]|nr:PQ-loop repeat-containing protein [Legionellaceae bacterium]
MIGAISLNISLALYLIVYIPQIIHNRNNKYLQNLSISMHFILYISYCLDLIYGFSSHLQWQYKTVSAVGLVLLIIQHLQITNHLKQGNQLRLATGYILFLLVTITFISCFLFTEQFDVSQNTILAIGYLSRILFVMYTLPQIIKNRTQASANAISINFLHINLVLAILDTISAWSLDWGWPNKLSAPITASLMLILLMQNKNPNQVLTN